MCNPMHIWQLILILLSSMPFVGWAQPTYKIIDSGFPAKEGLTSQTYFWIDNEKIIFTGLTGEYDDLSLKGGAGKSMHTAVYVWSVPDNKVTQVTKSGAVHCASNGYVRYVTTDTNGSLVWYKGLLGEERPFAVKKEGRKDIEYLEPNLTTNSFSLFDCRDRVQDMSKRDEKIIQLQPSHGYLDGGSRLGKEAQNSRRYQYFPIGSEKGIEMPFKTRESGGGIRYYPFKGAYFIGSSFFDEKSGQGIWPWPSNLSRPLWWLYPDGRVEEIRLRPGLPVDTYILPSKPGILIVSHRFEVKNGPSEDGAYLVRDGEVQKLIAGSIAARGGDISPDGCNFAIVHSYFWDYDKRINTIKVINLCEGMLK